MTKQKTSLEKLVEDMQIYEEKPVAIPNEVRRGAWIALATNLVGVPAWVLLIDPFPITILLVASSRTGLLLALALILESRGMTRPVSADMQRLAWLASIPGGVNAVCIGVAAALGVAAVAVGILLILAFTGILGAVLGAAALGR